MTEIELIKKHYGDFTGLYDLAQAVAHVRILLAEAARAKPVLDKAQAWRDAMHEEMDERYCAEERELGAAVDGWKNPTPDEPDDEERVCAIVGCDEQAEAWGVCGEHMPGGPAHLAAEGLSSTDTTEAGQ